MGGCASGIQAKQDVQVRKVKLSQFRIKQREELKKQFTSKDNSYFGQDKSYSINIDEYLKQGHVLGNVGSRITSNFLGHTQFDFKQLRIFQPMLKNMVLDHQESFPRWLISDEQFRDDQMQEFISKCQETAKLQSTDVDIQENQNEHEDNDEEDEDSNHNHTNSNKFNKNVNTSSGVQNRKSSASDEDDKQDEENNSFTSDNEKLIKQNSKKVQQNNQFKTGMKEASEKEVSKNGMKGNFIRAKSIIEEKVQIDKSPVEIDDSDSNHSSDNENRNKENMHKFQGISGLRNNPKKNSKLIQKESSGGEEGLKNGQSGQLIPSLKVIKNDDQMLSSIGNGLLTSGRKDINQKQDPRLLSSKNIPKRGARASNSSNHYVIKEFNIIQNNWVHTAICMAEIKTPTSVLEFKRRYFYEFDKLSAFLSQLLALKRMNFPNLLTFSYVQIGEASYNGDSAALKKKLEQMKNQQYSQQSQQYNLRVSGIDGSKSREPSIIPTNQKQRINKKSGTLLIANSQLAASQRINSTVNYKEEVDEEEEDLDQESRLIMYVDRIFPECGKNLEEIIHGTTASEDILQICIKGFKVFDAIANTLSKMHRSGFSYRVLSPKMIRIIYSDTKEFSAFLDSPDFVWGEVETIYLSKFVQTEIDFLNYDCKCLSALMIYYFLTIQNHVHKRKNSRLEIMNAQGALQNNLKYESLNAGGNNGTLKNISSQNLIPNLGQIQSQGQIPNFIPMSFAEIVAIQDQAELESIFKKLKLPQIALETIQQLSFADLKQQKSMEEFAVKIQGVLEKGPQTAFKHDSFSAYLQFHGARTLKNENMHVYFRRKNQIHFYEFESKTFKVIKLNRKKTKFPVRTFLTFSHYDNCFYFFAANNSNKVVKVPLDTDSKQRHVINQKSEVIFFKSIKNIDIEDPQILSVIPDDYCYCLYIFNNKKNTDNETNDVYYNSFIISISYKQEDPQVDSWKEKIQVLEGPRNYTWRRRAYHFYDPHNKFIYCILDSNNIFQKGIRFSYFDTSIEKGDFKDGNLRFACSTENVKHLNCMKVGNAKPNIFTMLISTLKQLLEYSRNNKRYPRRYQYVYEILNQPFEVKFNNAQNMGKNVVFQEGMLHILGRKEVETVICSYELLPTQGVMVLKKCISLHSFDDILLKIPKQFIEIWNFQEFKKTIFNQEGKETTTGMQNSLTHLQTSKSSRTNGIQLTTLATNSSSSNLVKNSSTLITNQPTLGKQQNPQPNSSHPDKSRGSGQGIHMNEQGGQLSKQDEINIQRLVIRISQISEAISCLEVGEDSYHEIQYKELRLIQETAEYKLVRLMHHASCWNVRRANINNIQIYEQYIQLLELNSLSNYLMQIKQCFMSQDDETGTLTINLVEEDSDMCLHEELEKRCAQQTIFKSQEVGSILKAIFKAIIGLQSIELVHGSINPRVIHFTTKGFIRLAGWYLDNREGFENDFIDACSLIFQIATLTYEPDTPFVLTPILLQQNQEKLKNYPGLFQFLLNNLLILQDGENLKLEQVQDDVREVYQNLQVNYLKQNKEYLSSRNKRVFWVNYGANQIVSCDYLDNSFCSNEIIYHNNLPFKFSKYNMFTFDSDHTMYMAGAIKEDFKVPSQLFYSMDFSFEHESKIKIKQLKDIPNSILQPSLFFCNDYVYCIGGYQIKFDGSKSISKKAYRYSIKLEDWEQLSDMPVGVVSSTIISGSENDILYLFGGVSEDIDLRGKELNYLAYDIEVDEWFLKLDLSMRSPYVNNRYVKPTIDHIGKNIYISLQRTSDAIFVQFFELTKGGINLKFKIEEEQDDIVKEQFADIDIFNEITYQDYFKAYQDDLSFIFIKDTVYLLDEFSNALITINFSNFNNIKYDRIPCGIISVQRNECIDKEILLEKQASDDSFYFNGY